MQKPPKLFDPLIYELFLPKTCISSHVDLDAVDTRFCFHPVSRLNRCEQGSQSEEADGHTEREDLTCELHVERPRRTGRHLSPAAVSGVAGNSSTFPAFPEIGTVQDSRNFRNEPGGVGGVETGWDIKVSVVEWCYQRTLF